MLLASGHDQCLPSCCFFVLFFAVVNSSFWYFFCLFVVIFESAYAYYEESGSLIITHQHKPFIYCPKRIFEKKCANFSNINTIEFNDNTLTLHVDTTLLNYTISFVSNQLVAEIQSLSKKNRWNISFIWANFWTELYKVMLVCCEKQKKWYFLFLSIQTLRATYIDCSELCSDTLKQKYHLQLLIYSHIIASSHFCSTST